MTQPTERAEAAQTLYAEVRAHWNDPAMPWPLERLREFTQLSDELPTRHWAGKRWQEVTVRVADIRVLVATVDRLAAEVEQLQVELGHALAPDEDEPLTLRDVDPDAVYATEDDDYDDERAEAYAPGGYSEEAPF